MKIKPSRSPHQLRAVFWCFLFAAVLSPQRGQAAAGAVDLSFDPISPPNSSVWKVIIQNDGKAILLGQFSQLGNIALPRIARISADGSVDPTFTPGAGPAGGQRELYAAALQADGKIVVGGDFTSFNGVVRSNLVRLLPSGGVDSTFDPAGGCDSRVEAIAIQSDGKILLGGSFRSVNGVRRVHAARLNPDGSLDSSFDVGNGPTGLGGGGGSSTRDILAFAILPSGKILAGGWFHEFDGLPQPYLVRLNPDGRIDTTFNGRFDLGTQSGLSVNRVLVQPDGKILVAGGFESIGGTPRGNIARLEPDGALDATFNTIIHGDPVRRVYAAALQADGKVLLGGAFRTFAGAATTYGLLRVNPDGSEDTTFQAFTNGLVNDLVLQSNTKITIGGSFREVHGIPRECIARLHGDNSGTTSTNPAIPSSIVVTSPLALGRPVVLHLPRLFRGAVDLGGNWKWLAWFGMYYDLHAPWYYHHEHGYLHTISQTDSSIWFYQASIGWFWTSDTAYPLIYRDRDGVWLGYITGTKNPRWFWNYSTQSLEAIN